MEHLFRSYLELLQSILSNLSQLTKLVHRKIEVAQTDDLEALDEILNEEQALALAPSPGVGFVRGPACPTVCAFPGRNGGSGAPNSRQTDGAVSDLPR